MAEDVKLSRMVVSPDHRDALLEWRAPHRMYGDIVGRAVVEPKGDYLLIAIRIDPTTPEGEKVNELAPYLGSRRSGEEAFSIMSRLASRSRLRHRATSASKHRTSAA